MKVRELSRILRFSYGKSDHTILLTSFFNGLGDVIRPSVILPRLYCQILPRPLAIGNAQRQHDRKRKMFARPNNVDEAHILIIDYLKYARLFKVRREMRLEI
jgi:hypothetical protein